MHYEFYTVTVIYYIEYLLSTILLIFGIYSRVPNKGGGITYFEIFCVPQTVIWTPDSYEILGKSRPPDSYLPPPPLLFGTGEYGN